MSVTTRAARRSQLAAEAAAALKKEEERHSMNGESELFTNQLLSLDDSASEVSTTEMEVLITRYRMMGDMASAEYWTDRKFANEITEAIEGQSPYPRTAVFIQNLSKCRCFLRVIAYTERFNLHTKHLFFAHFYVVALTERRQWQTITTLPIGHLVNVAEACLKTPSNLMYLGGENDLPPLSPDDMRELDELVGNTKMRSSLLVNMGKAFLFSENRDAASVCLGLAYSEDPTNLHAQQLLSRYNLLTKATYAKFDAMRNHRRMAYPSAAKFDPKEQLLNATVLFDKGDASAVNQITSSIINNHGLYKDALLLHIASLAQLQDENTLFSFAHRLVDCQPESEISWYAVALYYYVCKNTVAAKSFMSKATSMNDAFCEGWLAFGHILATDGEHEQAMNCYFRAQRVQERSFEPTLYIAMAHTFTNNFKLAADFLKESIAHSPNSPIVLHEMGSHEYTNGKYVESEKHFIRALKIICDIPEDMDIDPTEILKKPLDMFWVPLINNLGHVCRRLGKLESAIKYHQKVLLMSPRKLSTLTSLGMIYARMRQFDKASEQFHLALAVKPFNTIVRQALERMVKEIHERSMPGPRRVMNVDELIHELNLDRGPLHEGVNKKVNTQRRRHNELRSMQTDPLL